MPFGGRGVLSNFISFSLAIIFLSGRKHSFENLTFLGSTSFSVSNPSLVNATLNTPIPLSFRLYPVVSFSPIESESSIKTETTELSLTALLMLISLANSSNSIRRED
jgi:hypothetical protein